MDYHCGEQLSLIAEETSDDASFSDWSIDVDDSYSYVPLRERSHEQIRQHFVTLARGGQIKNSPPQSAPHDGGQTGERGFELAPHDGGQNKNPPCLDVLFASGNPTGAHRSEFAPHEGDDRTWIEIHRRLGGEYKYLRWRECSGKKRSKYLGKVA